MSLIFEPVLEKVKYIEGIAFRKLNSHNAKANSSYKVYYIKREPGLRYLYTWNLSKFKVHLSNQTTFIRNMKPFKTQEKRKRKAVKSFGVFPKINKTNIFELHCSCMNCMKLRCVRKRGACSLFYLLQFIIISWINESLAFNQQVGRGDGHTVIQKKLVEVVFK